ncbi:hypothetical protein REPUB_Repub07fG0228300 [Reevesia pubescens]
MARNTKNAKIEMHEDDEEDKDRLSDLPDTIIIHILSLMETKFSVRTCVLSKRWKFLWASLPDLNLSASRRNELRFKEFAGQVLARRNDIPLSKLSFFCYVFDNYISLIDSVLNYAVSHGVKHLSIFIPSTRLSLFPTVLSGCGSLRSLELSRIKEAALIASSIPLNLTTLKLIACSFSTNPQSSVDPFAGLVNLKNLQLGACSFRGFFKISGPKLDSLTLKTMFFYGDCNVEIFAPKLSSFSFQNSCPWQMESFTLDLPVLEIADIDARSPLFPGMEKSQRVILELSFVNSELNWINMFRGLSHAQSLKLSSRTIQVYSFLFWVDTFIYQNLLTNVLSL